jgi:hypothetical protein
MAFARRKNEVFSRHYIHSRCTGRRIGWRWQIGPMGQTEEGN